MIDASWLLSDLLKHRRRACRLLGSQDTVLRQRAADICKGAARYIRILDVFDQRRRGDLLLHHGRCDHLRGYHGLRNGAAVADRRLRRLRGRGRRGCGGYCGAMTPEGLRCCFYKVEAGMTENFWCTLFKPNQLLVCHMLVYYHSSNSSQARPRPDVTSIEWQH